VQAATNTTTTIIIKTYFLHCDAVAKTRQQHVT